MAEAGRRGRRACAAGLEGSRGGREGGGGAAAATATRPGAGPRAVTGPGSTELEDLKAGTLIDAITEACRRGLPCCGVPTAAEHVWADGETLSFMKFFIILIYLLNYAFRSRQVFAFLPRHIIKKILSYFSDLLSLCISSSSRFISPRKYSKYEIFAVS